MKNNDQKLQELREQVKNFDKKISTLNRSKDLDFMESIKSERDLIKLRNEIGKIEEDENENFFFSDKDMLLDDLSFSWERFQKADQLYEVKNSFSVMMQLYLMMHERVLPAGILCSALDSYLLLSDIVKEYENLTLNPFEARLLNLYSDFSKKLFKDLRNFNASKTSPRLFAIKDIPKPVQPKFEEVAGDHTWIFI